MTTPNLPTAAEALAAAWSLVSLDSVDTSDLDIRRAEVMLGVARELREEAQFRAVDRRRAALLRTDHLHMPPVPAASTERLEELAEQFRKGSPANQSAEVEFAVDGDTIAARYAKGDLPGMPNRYLLDRWNVAHPDAVTEQMARTLRTDAAATLADLDPGLTQRLPVVWSVGDKADCKNCHTPIVLEEAETTGLKADNVKVWRHKYTGQAVCADAVTMGRLEEGAEQRPAETTIVHTFAEPSIEG